MALTVFTVPYLFVTRCNSYRGSRAPRSEDSLVLAIPLLIFRPSFLIIVEPKEKFHALFDHFNNRRQPVPFK